MTARLRAGLAGAGFLIAAGCAANPAPVAPVMPPPPAPVAQRPVAVAPPAAPPVVAPPPVAAPIVSTPAPSAAGDPRETLAGYLDELRAVSCPQGVKKETAESVELKIARVPLAGLNPAQKKIGQLSFVAGFHLTSPDKRLGGLSGIDFVGDNRLLAVSDQGDFVWIDLAEDGVTPTAARISSMRDAAGDSLRGKANGDAESLATQGGFALVGYERNDRVLAFDLGQCGAAARGAPVVVGRQVSPLRDVYAQQKLDVGENSGPEPLAVTPDWYVFTGLESKAGDESPLSARPIEAAADFNLRIGKGDPAFVGADVLPAGKDGKDVRLFSLHRGTERMLGAAIVVNETVLERYLDQSRLPARIVSEIDERSHVRFKVKSTRRLASMGVLVTIDNFEGIAAREMPNGKVRLYIISDDNFSTSQRTLLMIYDVD